MTAPFRSPGKKCAGGGAVFGIGGSCPEAEDYEEQEEGLVRNFHGENLRWRQETREAGQALQNRLYADCSERKSP